MMTLSEIYDEKKMPEKPVKDRDEDDDDDDDRYGSTPPPWLDEFEYIDWCMTH